MAAPPQLDPVTVATTVLAAMVGPVLAPVLGAYAVIVIAASTGAAWALGRRAPGPRWAAAGFMLRINGTALLTSWVIAAALQRWLPAAGEATWLLAPVALVIGAVGDDWPGIGRWMVARIGRRVDRTLDTADPPEGRP